jgi:hypothetical protein
MIRALVPLMMIAAAGGVPSSSQAVAATPSPQSSPLKAPVLVLARSKGAKLVSSAQDEPLLSAIFDVRLEIEQVLAGDGWRNMDDDSIVVRLRAENPGFLASGVKLIVLLDPVLVSQKKELYWRRPMTVYCVSKEVIEDRGLVVNIGKPIRFGRDVCINYD